MYIGYWWEMPERKRPLERPRCRWVNNVKMDLREIIWDDVDWIDVAQVKGPCEHCNEPSGSIKRWEVLE
jgi:hypothetical protein